MKLLRLSFPPLATKVGLAAVAFVACTGTPITGPVPVAVASAVQSASVSGVVISQVYGGGGNSGSTWTHDFIELYNAGSSPVSLAGWTVQYGSSAGTASWLATPLSGEIKAGAYYLVRQSAGAGGTTPLPTPDATGSTAISATAGKVALVSSTTPLFGACPTANVVDVVGFGAANCFETAPTPALSTTTAAIRKGAGTVDTDNNSSDFEIGAPTPRNSAMGRPQVTATTPASGATAVALNANLGVTFSKAVTLGDDWYAISCTSSGSHTAVVTGSGSSYTLNPATDFADAESCTTTVYAAKVADATDAANTMQSNFSWTFTTVAANACNLPFTAIPAIQGSGLVTPLANQVVTTMGVVVGDYEGAAPALRGFYLQDATGDGDPNTSDGIFVFNGTNDQVSIGDRVRVTGRVEEFQDQTQIGNVTEIHGCGTGFTIAPVDVTLPLTTATDLERFEGMLVRLSQTLHVTETFQLGRFGQVVLSSGSRLFQPTSIAAPGGAAMAIQAQNNLNRIILDDARNDQNPDPILFARGGNPLSASNTLRIGDAVTGVVGVLTYTWGGNAASGNNWRVRPINAMGGGVPNFVAANARPATPPAVGGTLRVASMNLLNYFNSFSGCRTGVNGAPTDCRGAGNATEFARQWPKTVAAITAMNPDILGVMEIENDGYGPESALAHLVGRLNDATAPGTWAYVDVDAATGIQNAVGSDAIRVALLYKPAAVSPVATTAVLATTAFVNGGETGPRNRVALAQAFQQPNGARVVVSVNHFKSKGSGCDVPDAGDGQGACNSVRVAAAQQLAAWLATDPTMSNDPDVLILGDLNAYAKEDPVMALVSAGYTNLVESRNGPHAYSYVFDGQSGYLDHALATQTLASQVTGVGEWHINADEPAVLDYNTDFKSAGQLATLYQPDVYRVSDHDPILIGLELSAPVQFPFGGSLPPVNSTTMNRRTAGAAIPLSFSLGGDRGLDIFIASSPLSRPISCTTGTPLGTYTPIQLPGKSGLTYARGSDRYHLTWKTFAEWTDTCRELQLRLKDNSEITLRFQFTAGTNGGN